MSEIVDTEVKRYPIDIPAHLADETIHPLEYSMYTIWAEALGLKQLLRTSNPAEIEACRYGLLEAAKLILTAMEVKNENQ